MGKKCAREQAKPSLAEIKKKWVLWTGLSALEARTRFPVVATEREKRLPGLPICWLNMHHAGEERRRKEAGFAYFLLGQSESWVVLLVLDDSIRLG